MFESIQRRANNVFGKTCKNEKRKYLDARKSTKRTYLLAYYELQKHFCIIRKRYLTHEWRLNNSSYNAKYKSKSHILQSIYNYNIKMLKSWKNLFFINIKHDVGNVLWHWILFQHLLQQRFCAHFSIKSMSQEETYIRPWNKKTFLFFFYWRIFFIFIAHKSWSSSSFRASSNACRINFVL